MRLSLIRSMATPAAMFLALHVSASPPESQDPDTRAWWGITAELSGDAMEGRDTGSPGYDRAAEVVAAKFAAAGLKPLGEKGGWLQPVALSEVRFDRVSAGVGDRPLKFLYDFALKPTAAMATTLEAGLAYRGYCDPATLGDVKGKVDRNSHDRPVQPQVSSPWCPSA